MRYSQIKPLHEQRLDEINMSPASLRQLASKIEGAMAGLEFELVIPGMNSDSDDGYGEPEPDYDSDESARSISNIIEFFNDNEYNSRRDISDLQEKLETDFFDWQSEKMGDAFANEDLTELVTNYYTEEEGLEGDELELAVADELDRPSYITDTIRETWEEDNRDSFDDERWLRDEGYRTMQNIEDNYTINWPHYSFGNSNNDGNNTEPKEVADDFSAAIGRPVEVNSSYHNAKRQTVGANHYIAEPDSSIEGNDGEGGLEFVAPPLTVSEMISDLKKVAAWCKRYGAYTNDSTGLHINISVPNYTVANLDFIKLALLMGDEYVSSSFGRLGASYAKSALGIIKKQAGQRPEAVQKLLDQMRVHLNTAASKLVHSGVTDKMTSINTKDGRVEFRSPGGNWLKNFESGKVENTMLRFVVALDAAVDETKYKDEYAKKLYKLLAPADDGGNTMQYFARYVAGSLPKTALKSFIKQAQLQRTIKKDAAAGSFTGNELYWWKVSRRENSSYSQEVAAKDAASAISYVVAQDDGPWAAKAGDFEAVAVRPYTEAPTYQSQDPVQAFELYRLDNNRAVQAIQASSMQEALEKAEAYLNSQGLGNSGFNVRLASAGDDTRRAATANGPAAGPLQWQVFGDNGQFVAVSAADEQEAQAVAARRYGDALGDPANYQISRIES